MKKSPIICLLLAFFMLISVLFPVTSSASSPAVERGCNSLQARVPLGGTQQLTETAKAVLLYELNTDTLVYAWNPDQRIDPSGMVKILTALVALEHGNLEDEVTVDRDTLNSVGIGIVSANLQSGEVITVRDLLYCVMVKSANDACAVLAKHIGGTQAEFVAMMNEKARQLGCTDSHFANAHGLGGTDQYSTARDLAIITAAALENELFASMFSLQRYTVPATNKSEERYLITSNYMLSDEYIKNYRDTRVTGGKTAAATLTDRSVILTAESGTSRYLCIVMSAQAQVSDDGLNVKVFGSFDEAKVALDYGFRNFAVRQVVDQRQIYAQYAVAGGENHVTVSTTEDLFTVLPVDHDPEKLYFDTVVDASHLQAPLEKDAIIGQLQISYDGIILGSCDLKANQGVSLKGDTIQNANRIDGENSKAFPWKQLLIGAGILLLAAVVIFVLVLVAIRLLRSARIKRQHRRRMRSRRRSR